MLKALYDYAQRTGLPGMLGYEYKEIRAFICLTEDGVYSGVFRNAGRGFRCPDIGSLANGTDKCNLLAEKRSVIFPEKPDLKSQFFRDGLKDLGDWGEPKALLCLHLLEDRQSAEIIREDLERNKIKSSDRISFMVGNTYLVESPSVQAWWEHYRMKWSQSDKPSTSSLCLITGHPTTPLKTVPKTKGLQPVGGHGSGDALLCFDKSAFCSYGFDQSENAAVSEEAFSKVKEALDLLLQDAPVLAGMKFVHWYNRALPEREPDPIPLMGFFPEAEQDGEPDEEDERDPADDRQARRNADRLVGAVESGAYAETLPDRYYIALLSGATGRVVVRRFFQGSYEDLKAHIDQWNGELQLINSHGTAMVKPHKLIARFITLLHQKNGKDIYSRVSKELSGLTAAVVFAVVNGTRLPDTVATRALSVIRSQMMSEEKDGSTSVSPDPCAVQWLKVWLIRNHQEVDLMSEYNPHHPSAVYHTGAMVAVYAALQKIAYPDVNVSLVQRYFASAQQTPAFVLGRLARLSTHHLAKLDNPYIARGFETRLAEVSARIGDRVPDVLTLPEQSLFTLGYYQMLAALNKERAERYANLKTNLNQEQEN